MALELVGTYHKYIGISKKSIFALLLDGTYRLYEEAGLPQDATDTVLPDNATMWSNGADLNETIAEKWRNVIEDYDLDEIEQDLLDIPLAGTAEVRGIVERMLLREKSRIQAEIAED